tara:strand:- start:451 stop:675 length:225 start_codon:yes stop_codon:yes gene_type:complete
MSDTSESDFEKTIGIINNCINKLPKKYREVFILSKKRGFTNMEISEILNILIKTVESHISYAFKNIKLNMPNRL